MDSNDQSDMPNANFSLLDLRALSEPASKLIDVVGSAVGILYEPTRIRRRAKAEADATLIAAEGQIAVDDLVGRATARVSNRELRRQENIESVVTQAIDFLPESVSSDEVDEDWVIQFFEYSQDVSNEKMKSLWAKLLAGEVSRPRSFSLRTLNVVKHLRQTDAMLFSKACTYLWSENPVDQGRLFIGNDLFDDSDDPTAEIHFGVLKYLESIGLIQTDVAYTLRDKPLELFYFGKGYRFTVIAEEKKGLLPPLPPQIGSGLLTDVGMELAPLSGAEPDLAYREAVINAYERRRVRLNDL